ncbi:MAG: hypothetical protein WC967_09535 [Balneolaceae bacterium]
MKTLRFIAIIWLTSLSWANAQTVSTSDSVTVLFSGLEKPSALYVTQHDLYIVEQGKSRILQLDHSGNLVHSFGNKGSSDYQFNLPLDIDATNGLKVFVSDVRNNRIQVFDKHWQLLSSIQNISDITSNRQIEPTWLGVNRVGELIFFDKRSKNLIKINEKGSFMDEIPLPLEVKDVSGLQLNEGNIFIIDKKQQVIHQLSENGFYKSFYPAEGAQAFRKSNDGMWISRGNSLFKSGANKKDYFEVNSAKSIKDFVATEGIIYILTDNSLIKMLLPK